MKIPTARWHPLLKKDPCTCHGLKCPPPHRPSCIPHFACPFPSLRRLLRLLYLFLRSRRRGVCTGSRHGSQWPCPFPFSFTFAAPAPTHPLPFPSTAPPWSAHRFTASIPVACTYLSPSPLRVLITTTTNSNRGECSTVAKGACTQRQLRQSVGTHGTIPRGPFNFLLDLPSYWNALATKAYLIWLDLAVACLFADSEAGGGNCTAEGGSRLRNQREGKLIIILVASCHVISSVTRKLK
jgi:hypothetical protein